MLLNADSPKKEEDTSSWPQTTQVFDKPSIDFQKHEWVQQGYEIIDSCPTCPRQGISIPYGKMLVRAEGKYKLVDEI